MSNLAESEEVLAPAFANLRVDISSQLPRSTYPPPRMPHALSDSLDSQLEHIDIPIESFPSVTIARHTTLESSETNYAWTSRPPTRQRHERSVTDIDSIQHQQQRLFDSSNGLQDDFSPAELSSSFSAPHHHLMIHSSGGGRNSNRLIIIGNKKHPGELRKR